MSATLLLSCSFSRRSASRMMSVLGPEARPARLALRRVLNSARSSTKAGVGALLFPAPFVPFWAAASFKAEISRFNLLTWASDSASSTFSSSIFSSRSWCETETMFSFDVSEVGLGRVDHDDANLFELARKNVYNSLLLSLVGVDEVFLTFACRSAGLRISPDGGRQRHGSQGPNQRRGLETKVHFRIAEAVRWKLIGTTHSRAAHT